MKDRDSLTEKCAVFGIYGTPDASFLASLGLLALQHRGQDSSGISASDTQRIHTYKRHGLVSEVFSQESIEILAGSIAIGHNRYATSGDPSIDHAQPVVADDKALFALAHNGNLAITHTLEAFLQSNGISTKDRNDSEMMYDAIEYYLTQGDSIEDAIKKCYPLFTGAFSLTIMTHDALIGVRDRCGIRPLALGKLLPDMAVSKKRPQSVFALSSETCGLDSIGATYIRDVAPGEMVVIRNSEMVSYQIQKGEQKLDIFEMIYFARPDSTLLGKSVYHVRKNLGKILAREFPIDADIVIPVPDSSIPVAFGYAEISRMQCDFGLLKNRYVHRTFIEPSQSLRIQKVRMKFNPIKGVIQGKHIIVIDDSIVRGTTSKELVTMLRNSGASRISLLIASPPVRYPDYYGIDTPNHLDLIASHMSINEIRRYIGADFLGYISYNGMIEATELSENLFSTSCFSGIYPIDVGEERMEQILIQNKVHGTVYKETKKDEYSKCNSKESTIFAT